MPFQDYSYDINIEFAHIVPNASRADSSFRLSYSLLLDYIDNVEQRGENFCISILVDDKEVGQKLSISWLTEQLDKVNFRYYNILYWVMESELRVYRECLYSLIKDDHRVHISKQIENYLKKHGELACSHDIAIWHLLRLGVIQPLEKVRVGRFAAQLQSPNFSSKRVASILTLEDSGVEERATTEILNYLRNAPLLVGRINKIFYEVR